MSVILECSKCKSKGLAFIDVLTDENSNTFDYTKARCTTCKSKVTNGDYIPDNTNNPYKGIMLPKTNAWGEKVYSDIDKLSNQVRQDREQRDNNG